MLLLAAHVTYAEWTLVAQTAPWGPRAGHASEVHDGGLWVIGGGPLEPSSTAKSTIHPKNDVWRSSDGVAWTLVADAAPWAPRTDHEAVSFAGRLWLLGGRGLSRGAETEYYADLWASDDGASWERVMDETPWASSAEAVVYADALWVVW
ncbi:MAG TPA: hypothetical protein PKL84_12895, partial [Candidatus Hydrogenedentes bacterium]|nr:hypothetical protein [Candidatus Hydrogenedentota bacterium]